MTAADNARPAGIVVATHGELARALIASAEMIVGVQENVVPVCLSQEDSPETFQQRLKTAIQRVDSGAGVLILIDLFGGTPGNSAALAVYQSDLQVVSGVNLPMLIEVLLSRQSQSPKELAAHAMESGKIGIVDITAKVREQMRAA